MPKTKISEFSSTPANNTDIDSINIAENCPPSGINDAIRELMAQLKDFQVGSAGDPVTVGGVLTVQAGSASTPALTTAGDTNTGIFFPAADTIAFTEGGVEAMRLDSAGNVGIGRTSNRDSTKLDVFGDITFGGNASYYGTLAYNASSGFVDLTSSDGGFRFIRRSGSAVSATLDSSGNLGLGVTPSASESGFGLQVGTAANTSYVYSKRGVANNAYYDGAWKYYGTGAATLHQFNSGVYAWYNAPSGTAGNAITFTQAMTLDASGNLGIGTTSPSAKLDVNGAVIVQGNYVWQQADGNGKGFLLGSSGSANGLISQTSGGSGSTATYIGNAQIVATSDARLKENIVDSQRNALGIIDNLRIVDFTWNDPSDQAVNNKASRGVWTGLIAQEAVAHIPWLINKPTEDTENGKPVYWTVDYGHSVPFLIKAIQEQQAIIESLKARLDAANL